MSFTVFMAVIGAAVLHAAWNTLLKGGQDKVLSMGAIVLGQVPLGLITLIFFQCQTLKAYHI